MTQLPFIIDRRVALKGRAATHALLIGVSRYDREDSLAAGAHTAVRLFEWLKAADAAQALPAPLATATLLLSPGAAETAMVCGLVGQNLWALATRANVLAACDRLRVLMLETERDLEVPDPEMGAGLALYYFGGHGVDFFREDPIGLASDADLETEPWAGAFDHQEYREHLTRIDDGNSVDADHRARCLFLYDCCRTRNHGAAFATAIQLENEPVLSTPDGVRPFQVLSAAAAGFSAWEPGAAIDLPPHFELPLSFFGQALLNALGWSQDYSTHPEFPWHTAARGLVDDLARAMKELAAHEGTGERLDSPPVMQASPPDFPVVRSVEPPTVRVTLRCDPVNGHESKLIQIAKRTGSEYIMELTRPPWTRHPETLVLVSGIFRIAVTGPGGAFSRALSLRPVLTAWEWIVRDAELSVHDPSK